MHGLGDKKYKAGFGFIVEVWGWTCRRHMGLG